MKIYDISIPISAAMHVYPGDPAVQVDRVMRMAAGDVANVSFLKFGTHTGTHIDAPMHFVDGAMTVDKIPLNLLIGKARVVEVTSPSTGRVDTVQKLADYFRVPSIQHYLIIDVARRMVVPFGSLAPTGARATHAPAHTFGAPDTTDSTVRPSSTSHSDKRSAWGCGRTATMRATTRPAKRSPSDVTASTATPAIVSRSASSPGASSVATSSRIQR